MYYNRKHVKYIDSFIHNEFLTDIPTDARCNDNL